MAHFSQILVLDFDGTVCLGDGPVFVYARLIDEALASSSGGHPVGLVGDVVARFLGAGEEADHEPNEMVSAALELVGTSADGYSAAEKFARSLGITDAQLSAAYTGSRRDLAAGLVETHAPAGLGALLGSLPARVQIVLVTNAPDAGVHQQLTTLELAEYFDDVITSAGKPAGMPAVLAALLEAHQLTDHPERLLSVGDIWQNDLEPAARLGAETALIERLAAPGARPTYRAETIEELYPAITAWASASSA
ncbi:HAD family hydrolase [Subtercola vilae]|uniref:HAD family hydrolase n=1 Tax=Subtercola vilae TaxID=2056433 RepID=A0A4T2BUV6_9MICO|nr:HAD family hydrolase [Subtercola vilae]TIH35170.1 HAD family hydrolase [Subtercola vilae]